MWIDPQYEYGLNYPAAIAYLSKHMQYTIHSRVVSSAGQFYVSLEGSITNIIVLVQLHII